VTSEPPPRAPTIYDVAKAAGVAASTVSRAFSRPGRVNAETAARVREVAADLGYRANPMARALPTGRTSMLAVIVSDVTNPFFFEIIRGVESAAAESGYVLLLVDTHESPSDERAALDRAIGMVDAIVLASSRMSDNAIRMIAKQRPTVVLNRPMPDVLSVVSDNELGMHDAVAHLAELGHRAVTYVAGPDASWSGGMRWRAIRAATAELGLRLHQLGPFAPTLAGGLEAVRAFADHPTTAVVAYNDLQAIGVIQGLARGGVRVPDDVSVIGFDNIFGSDFCSPPLTTVAAQLRALGTLAARMVLDQVADAARGPFRPQRAVGPVRPVVLPAQLLVRGSTGQRRQD